MWVEPVKNGKIRYVERYTDPLSEKVKKVSIVMDKDTRANRKLAQDALNDKIAKKVDAVLTPTAKVNLTLSDLCNAYLQCQEHTVVKSTYSRNSYAVHTILRLLGADTLAENLTAGYVKERFSSDTTNPGTINERYTRFKAIIRWGYQNDYLSDIHYIDKLVSLKDDAKADRLRNKYLESDELTALLHGMAIPVWRDLTEFLALSGLRCGEALALTISDVDFANHTISVTKTYDFINDLITDPKTPESVRDVYMQPELVTLCKNIHKRTMERKIRSGSRSKWFFCDRNGNQLDYFSYNKYLKENGKRILGKDHVTTHVMRHTHTSLMAEQGVSLDVISRRLGHRSSDITRDIYLHITKRQKEKDKETMQKVQLL